ncbi:YqfO family protein [Thiomicrorhabdus sp.]|uniref:YqfO family protein n=1 Tax=Thiomicrorhabdus sp. TaxID=2039724 RepID=UPI002AA63108|nr:YqfO family protein [Thiomicrorhabdus sp.]
MYKVTFYVPESHLDVVKTAMFNAGAGNIGNYDSCCWQVKGQGQFRPLNGSNPFIGKENTVQSVEEFRVEMVVKEEGIEKVITALKNAHPYETPAFDVVELLDRFHNDEE